MIKKDKVGRWVHRLAVLEHLERIKKVAAYKPIDAGWLRSKKQKVAAWHPTAPPLPPSEVSIRKDKPNLDNPPWEGGRFKKRPVEIDAHQWFKNGDHPDDHCVILSMNASSELSEGRIVRRFNHPGINGGRTCEHCYGVMREHGWIETLEGGHIVCPGDWIITGVEGEHYPIKDGIFHKTYEPV